MSLVHLGRTCRLFWCYQCQRSIRIISTPSFQVSFCPRCYGQFLHELPFPPPPSVLGPTRPMPRSAPAPSPPVHPGDYFSGPGLPELISQLTQNDHPGPPPAPASAIDAMLVVPISAAHLRDGLQCPVCKEEFEVEEEVREMPCKHFYHSDCIVPWLRMHNSCPVCRLELPAATTRSTAGHSVRNGREEDTRRSNVAGGVVRRGQTRWNPIPALFPFWGSYNYYHGRMDEVDPLENPGAFYSWLRSWFLL